MALMTLQDLEHHYNKANFSNTSPVSLEDMSIYGNVAPMAVNVPSGLETINIAQVPEAQSVTQSNGLDYLLNQEGGQNQNLTVEEYNKAIANQNTEPTNNFLTRALSGVGDKFSNVMDNRYVQGARNLGSMITDPLMGGLSYLAQKADKFSSLPYVNQQFIKENMSYRNPDSGLPQDLFSINTRSLRGNYPEYVEKRSKELNESLEESKKDWEEKFGSLNAIDPRYNKTWAEMNKMNLSGQKYYGDKYLDFSKKKQAFDKSIELKEIEKKKNKIIAQEKEAAEKEQQVIESIRQQYAAQGRDYGQGAASQATQDSYQDSQGGYAGASTQDYGGGEKDGGYIDGTNRRRYGTGGIVSL